MASAICRLKPDTMPRKLISCGWLVCLLIAAMPRVHPKSAVLQPVVTSGDFLPGFTVPIRGLTVPSIVSRWRFTLTARFQEPGQSPQQGIWLFDGGIPYLIVRDGQPLPIPGFGHIPVHPLALVINDNRTYSLATSYGPVRQNETLSMEFRAHVGGEAPGTGGLTYHEFTRMLTGGAGSAMAWTATLAAGDGSIAPGEGLWMDDGTSISLVAREAFTLPGGVGRVMAIRRPGLVGKGVLFTALEEGGGGDRDSIWLFQGGTWRLMAGRLPPNSMEDVPPPQIVPGNIRVAYIHPVRGSLLAGDGTREDVLVPLYESVDTDVGDVRFTRIRRFAFGGSLAVIAEYRDPQGRPRTGVWAFGERTRLVAREDLSAPGTDRPFSAFDEVWSTIGGRVVFRGRFPDSNGAPVEGVWTEGPDGEVHLVARSGQIVEGLPAGALEISEIRSTHFINGNTLMVTLEGSIGAPGGDAVEGLFTATLDPAGPSPRDFGDAPVSPKSFPEGWTLPTPSGYPTSGPGAATHVLVEGFQLGANVDSESNGHPGYLADGDDLSRLDDDDGIIFPGPQGLIPRPGRFGKAVPFLPPGSTRPILIDARIPADPGRAALNGWVDFNGDGDWDDPGEHVITDHPVLRRNPEAPLTAVEITVPADAKRIFTYARFRLNATGGLGPGGPATEGEVEDYVVGIHEWPDAPYIPGDGNNFPPGADPPDFPEYSDFAKDFGDAPNAGTPPTGGPSVPTGYPDAGHVHYEGLSLGDLLDPEPGTPAGFVGGGDDAVGVDDEDGVRFTGAAATEPGIPRPVPWVVAGDGFEVEVTVRTPPDAHAWLHIWVDWNRDGDFDDSGEHAIPGQLFPQNAVTTRTVAVPFGAGTRTDPGLTFARFRVSTFADIPPGRVVPDGEVEDYLVRLAGLDFGDAPDDVERRYRTTMGQDGARHLVGGAGVVLGHRIDADQGGVQDLLAIGDDSDGVDDEDGILFETGLFPGQPARLTAILSAPGRLDAWVDWNRDGEWNPTGERIADNVLLSVGSNGVEFMVPADAVPGPTYARFRVSSAGGLLPWGLAGDGEVEDYRVEIGSTPTHIPVFFSDANTGEFTLVWAFGGILETATDLAGPWTAVPNAESPLRMPPSERERFFRLNRNVAAGMERAE